MNNISQFQRTGREEGRHGEAFHECYVCVMAGGGLLTVSWASRVEHHGLSRRNQ